MTTETQPEPTSCWWTPEGFATGMPPEAYTEMPQTGSWEEMMSQAGYKIYAFFGGEFDSLQLEIYNHRTQAHLLVAVDNENGGLGIFFVAERDQAAFFATWYVKFLRDAALVKQAESLSKIAHTLTAFVRHGHGVDTIDEYGENSLDDQIQWRAKRATERAAANKKS